MNPYYCHNTSDYASKENRIKIKGYTASYASFNNTNLINMVL